MLQTGILEDSEFINILSGESVTKSYFLAGI